MEEEGLEQGQAGRVIEQRLLSSWARCWASGPGQRRWGSAGSGFPFLPPKHLTSAPPALSTALLARAAPSPTPPLQKRAPPASRFYDQEPQRDAGLLSFCP